MLGPLLKTFEGALPSQCAMCHAWPSKPLCDACLRRFARSRARCLRCAIPVPGGVSECGRCMRSAPPIDACHAAVTYEYPWSALISQYKFQGQPGWARHFAALMRATASVDAAVAQADLVLPMPLARERLAERGFNQALLLARAMAPHKTTAGLLLRVRHTPAQSALNRQERLRNVKGAFALDPLRASLVNGKRVVLVDDVMTSGASLYSAAEPLMQAGAASIQAIVLARTDEHG